MTTQDKFLDALWRDNINSGMDGKWIAEFIKDAKRRPDGAFAEVGPILKNMLDKGISKEDICRLMRLTRYEALFDAFFNLEEDPLPADEFEGIHESFLSADPSGLEAAPGSWPLPKRQPRKKSGPADAGAPLLTVKKPYSFAFSPAARLVAASHDGKIWNIDSGKEAAKCQLYPHTSRVQFSPDGSRLAASNTAGIIAMFDSRSGERIFTHKMGEQGNCLLFSPDGKLLLADNWDGKLFVWQSADGTPLLTQDLDDLSIDSISFRAKGDCVLTLNPKCSMEHYLSIWGKNLKSEISRTQIKRPCVKMWLEPSEGKRAVIETLDEISLIEVPSGKIIADLQGVEPKAAVFSPDKKWVAIVGDNEFIVASSPSLLVAGRRTIKFANDIAFSQDGTLIGLASWNQGEIWDFATFLKANPA